MTNSEESFELLFISEEEADQRLDKILAKRFQEVHSRTYFQYLIQQHLVLLNGSPVKKRMKPQAGDEIEIQFAALPELELIAENIPLSILFEDEHLIAVNKPTGMVVHPAPGNWSGTFVNALLYYCQTLPSTEFSLRPGIVHRLDKDTSGVLIAAKTLETQQKLIELFATRQVYKEYLSVCVGKVGNEEIRAPIGRHPVHRKQMAVVSSGREAISVPHVLAWNGKLSLAKVVILTGRTHQIRVHLKHMNTPILGDLLYGSPSSNQHFHVFRPLLHALKMKFQHPITKQALEITAPLPTDMQSFIHKNFPEHHI